MSVASSMRSVRVRGTRPDSERTLYHLVEHVDVQAGELLLRSKGMSELKERNEHWYNQIVNTVSVARRLQGRVPVRYFMHEEQEGFGRMRIKAMIEGISAVPYAYMMREARAALAGSKYWDVDMMNAQPCLMLQTLLHHGITCHHLEHYVSHRDECLAQVMRECGVPRDAAKNLFLRLQYFGGVKGWLLAYPGVSAGSVPEWVHAFRNELRHAARALSHVSTSDIAQLRELQAKGGVDDYLDATSVHDLMFERLDRCSEPAASVVAIYMQTLECKCIRALFKAVLADDRTVGSLIHDGLLVQKAEHETALPEQLLRRWEAAIKMDTGFRIKLAVKPIEPPAAWMEPSPSLAYTHPDEEWMSGMRLMEYLDVKRAWEKHAFKVVGSGNYVREDPVTGERDVMQETQLISKYLHLSYYDVEAKRGSPSLRVGSPQTFIKRWIRDPQIRAYKTMTFLPPPLQPVDGAYSLWTPFAVERYDPGERSVDPNSAGVQLILGFLFMLFNRDGTLTEYILNYFAQMFQQPGFKSGVALLLRGLQGCGKNRVTDLLCKMIGDAGAFAKFLETASPAEVLYGRFTQPREGKILIVLNEATGADNHAADGKVKDMITGGSFSCEGKYMNSYIAPCYSRFIFTSNNANPLKVSADDRRYLIVEVSAEKKGDTQYFNELSRAIDDPHVRYEFYKHLMQRDIAGISWQNDKPVTRAFLDAVDRNLTYEQQFLKHYVLGKYHELKEEERRVTTFFMGDSLETATHTVTGGDAPRVKVSCEELLKEYMEWLGPMQSRTNTNARSLGRKLTDMIWKEDCQSGFKGMLSKRTSARSTYVLDIPRLAQEMVEKRWATTAELVTSTP